MGVISIHQAKSNLSQLVKRAAAGELVIGGYGQVEAVLVSPARLTSKPCKQIGLLAGKLTVPEDFDAPLSDDVLANFEGHGLKVIDEVITGYAYCIVDTHRFTTHCQYTEFDFV